MSISSIIFLAVYGVILVGSCIGALLNIMTCLRFSMHARSAAVMCTVFVGGIVLIVGVTAMSLSGVDWSSSISVNLPSITTGPTP